MFDFAISNNIKKVCIVPEKRKELTTEGGLDLKSNFFFKKRLPKLIEKNIDVSLFIDPNLDNIDLVKKLNINSVEIHTGNYANAYLKMKIFYLEEIKKMVELAK